MDAKQQVWENRRTGQRMLWRVPVRAPIRYFDPQPDEWIDSGYRQTDSGAYRKEIIGEWIEGAAREEAKQATPEPVIEDHTAALEEAYVAYTESLVADKV